MGSFAIDFVFLYQFTFAILKTVRKFGVQLTALLGSKLAQEKLRQIFFCFKTFWNCFIKIKPRIFFRILLRYGMFKYYCSFIAGKVSKYGVISGPHFLAFGMNTERYFVSVRMRENTDQK